MSIFYTSDLHFHHPKCLVFDHRPFKDIEEMQEEIVKRWNNKVTNSDQVYILGDFSMERSKVEKVNEVLKQLKGQKFLIKGNHDHYVNKGSFNKSLFQEIYDYKRIKDEGRIVILSHYPIAVWDCCHYGSIHLYGHVHNQEEALQRHEILKYMKNAYNVGCMNWNYEPVTLNEILAHFGAIYDYKADGVIKNPVLL